MNKEQIASLQTYACAYFVDDDFSGIIKIGKTNNFKQRFKSLQNSGANGLNVFDTVKTSNPGDVESIFHDFFKGERLHGEWFALTGFEDRVWIRFLCTSFNYLEGNFND